MKRVPVFSLPLLVALLVPLLAALLVTQQALAWDGFDAETSALIAISPEQVPVKGDTVDVRNYDTDSTETCLVESVLRNKRTIGVVVRTPEGTKRRTLVMESL